jgi:excisionase family DNA binding protein
MQVNGHQRKLSRQEAAERSGLSLKTIDRAIRERKLSSSKPCGRRLISEEDLAAYMGLNRIQSAAPTAFSAGLVGDQHRKALERFLKPLVEELVREELQRQGKAGAVLEAAA